MTLFSSSVKPTTFNAEAREVYDVTGAGDTVIAMFSACIAGNLSIDKAAYIANISAGLVVKKIGVASIFPQELEEAIATEEEATEELAEALVHEEEVSKELSEELAEGTEEEEEKAELSESQDGPFIIGDEVTHSAYGDGIVKNVRKTGKHWLIKINFESEERTILGSETFLRLRGEVEENKAETEEVKPDPVIYQKPTEEEETTEEISAEETGEEEENIEEKEEEVLETVVAEAVVPESEDYGDYVPGTKVKHDIFGIGEVKNSRPKGENYRLEIDFEDGTNKTLLSTFIEIHDNDDEAQDEEKNIEGETVIAEPVEAETEEENVEAEAVVAEAVETEDVLDTDVVYRRPKEGEDTEAVIDLSKPEVQDAEIVDDED